MIIVKIEIASVIRIEFPVINLNFSLSFSPIAFAINVLLETFMVCILICIIFITTVMAPKAPKIDVPNLLLPMCQLMS